MENTFTMSMKYERTEEGKTRLSRVIEYASGAKVEIPVNKDGSIKWFDDGQLIRKGGVA